MGTRIVLLVALVVSGCGADPQPPDWIKKQEVVYETGACDYTNNCSCGDAVHCKCTITTIPADPTNGKLCLIDCEPI